MSAHDVSNFEGGSACAMICLWMPLGGVAGFVCGFVMAFVVNGHGFAGFAKRQGIALVVAAALIGGTGLLVYASADHPPMIGGERISLEMEVRVPAKGRTVEQLRAEDFDVALVVSASDRNYSDMRWSDARIEAQFVVVPAWTTLNARNARRQITTGRRGESRQIFEVTLPAAPRQIEDEWSEWKAPTQLLDGNKPAPEDECFVRYRVRYTAEYSPTPPPPAKAIGPTQTPTPEAE
jgi:hypothetical protein